MSVIAERIGTKAEFAELGALLAGAGKKLAGKTGSAVKVLGWVLTLLAAGLSLLVGGGEEAATAVTAASGADQAAGGAKQTAGGASGPAALAGMGLAVGDWLNSYLHELLPNAVFRYLAEFVTQLALALDWALSLNLAKLTGDLTDAASASLMQLGAWAAAVEQWLFGAFGADGRWSEALFSHLGVGLDAIKTTISEKTPVKAVADFLNAVPGALAAVPLGVWLEKMAKDKA